FQNLHIIYIFVCLIILNIGSHVITQFLTSLFKKILVRSFVAIQPTLHSQHPKTDFFQQNYSLLLRNVQHNNTGNYKATATGNIEKTVGEYTVIVQDPVSPVNLTVTCIDRRFNNFTATCRTADSQINGTFQCNNITCRLLNQTHLKDSSLKIYLEESLITCNHSNNVSQEKSVKNVSSLCENLPVGGSVGAFVLLVSSIICFVVIKCKYLLIFSHNQIIVSKNINLEINTK
uniref:Immunoglobulin V-set domain-containing protein n=1 Tax=Poecilia reticulata TaxID=8081 RepID=A0A3P9MUQ7_POERE